MKRRQTSGFTVIELAVMIVVIGILATIVLVAYGRVQAEARDTKRKTDTEIFINEMEKYYDQHGEYPTGCSSYTVAFAASCEAGGATTTSGDKIYRASLLSDIKTMLPNVPDTFGDPKGMASMPFNSGNGKTTAYVYRGQFDVAPSSGSGAALYGTSTPIECNVSDYAGYVFPGSATTISSAFVVAYFGESDGKWYIYQGKRGIDLVNYTSEARLRGTTLGRCVFMP